MSLALLFHYLMLNMFRMLVHPSSGACDLFVELFHGLYCCGYTPTWQHQIILPRTHSSHHADVFRLEYDCLLIPATRL